MSITKYESGVRHIGCSCEKVYAALADMNNLKKLRSALESADFLSKANAQLDEETVGKVKKALDDMEIDRDSTTVSAPMMGKVTMRIVERQEPKLIKIKAEGLPVESYVWIQILPCEGDTCKMKVTAGAELNFFIKGMADKYLAPGVDKMAGILSTLPYDKI